MSKKGRAYLLVFGIIITYAGVVFAIQIAAPDNPIEPDNFPNNCPEDSINCSLIAPNHHRSGNLTEIRINDSINEVMEEVRKWIDYQ